MDDSLMLDTDDVRTLVDIGFISISRGLDQHAEAIFAGVKAARPEGEAGPIGTALVALYRGEFAAAVRILRGLPPSDAVLSFLGLALVRYGDTSEAREILEDIQRTAPGTPFARLADDILAEIAARPSAGTPL